MSIIEKLKIYAEKNLNVLLIGTHGVGKTACVEQVAKDLQIKIKYYSASTLDPWADLVGVPVPCHENESLKFYRPKDLEDAEFVFFDELNRAHPRVLNAVLEMIQFKRINGKPLKNLKMVWAAINPPGGEYNVEDLDPALVDRFHVYINMEPEFNMEYMKTKMQEETAIVLRGWWREDMNIEQRKLVTPRRLEYIGFLIDQEVDWEDALPQGALPNGDLRKRVRNMRLGVDELEINKENILANPNYFAERIKQDIAESIRIQEVMLYFSADSMFAARDLLESLPKDLVHNIGFKKFALIKRNLFNLFVSSGEDFKTKYPKIYDAFEFAQYNSLNPLF
jgi:hypothetical protein